MSSPDPRYPDKNSVPSIFGRKRKREPEQIAVDDAIERLSNSKSIPETNNILAEMYPPPPSPKIPHLDEIKVHLRQLTWAEMQEYCAGTNSDPKTVHEWSIL